jgi:hypothetical protein
VAEQVGWSFLRILIRFTVEKQEQVSKNWMMAVLELVGREVSR